MKRKVTRLSTTCCGDSREAGFFLAELQMTVAILALVTALLYGDFCQLLQGYKKIFIDMQLYDAARYMYSILEKELCYEGSTITLTEDYRGNPKVQCQTGHAGKNYTYTWENKSLYKTTKTTSTSGKNPLFVPDCQVVAWKAEKLGEQLVKISFALEKQGRRQNFAQVFHCFNGSVVYE